jgi:Uma2 family endonuclease
MAIAESLLTAEEYLLLPDNGQPTELVRGRVVSMNVPTPRHGQICNKVGRILGNFAEEHDLGHVLSNDSGVITERGPDTVRGPDVVFYSYAKVPKGPLPDEYVPVVPDAVFEVRSHFDRWPRILAKVAELLPAGVRVVCVLDSQTERVMVYRDEDASQVFTDDQELVLPEFHPDFRVPVRRLFD